MTTEQKDLAFLLRVGATEQRMLSEMTAKSGMNRAETIRQAIRAEYARTMGKASKPKARKPKK